MSHYLQKNSYRAAAKRLRTFADQIEAGAETATPVDRRRVTQAINGLSHYTKELCDRHRRAGNGRTR